MRKGFTVVEMIVSISLVALIGTLVLVFFKKIEPTYADVYENLKATIGDSASVYLNLGEGEDLKKTLMENGEVELNTNLLIKEGLLEESYYVKGIHDNVNVENLNIIVHIDDEGLLFFDINIK